jgi:hypothetical protein
MQWIHQEEQQSTNLLDDEMSSNLVPFVKQMRFCFSMHAKICFQKVSEHSVFYWINCELFVSAKLGGFLAIWARKETCDGFIEPHIGQTGTCSRKKNESPWVRKDSFSFCESSYHDVNRVKQATLTSPWFEMTFILHFARNEASCNSTAAIELHICSVDWVETAILMSWYARRFYGLSSEHVWVGLHLIFHIGH